ncbi:MAG: Nramp family divalent metal transporter [Planctomycetaceae bacterium]
MSPSSRGQQHEAAEIDQNTIPPEFDPADESGVMSPPRTLAGTLRQLGPGLIIAGSIVGSGELIATTKTGAQAGITLLWLIILGCLIKVFVQIELGRISICDGETTLSILNRVPGRIGPANWILWFWLAMMSASIAQLGGIVGGVGQAMALSFPISGDYRQAIETPSAAECSQYLQWDPTLLSAFDLALLADADAIRRQVDDLPGDDTVSLAIKRWLPATMKQSQTMLDGLDATTRDDLLAAFANAYPTDEIAAKEQGARLKTLRTLFEEINQPRLETHLAGQAGMASREPDEARRVERGHAILAEQLLQLRRRTESSKPLNAISVLAATLNVREAQARLDSLRKQEQEPSTRANAPARPSWTRPHAAVDVDAAKARINALTEPWTWDDKWWAAVVTALTVALLYRGQYDIIQNLSTVLVVLFTFVTIVNVFGLQSTEQWHLSGATILRGLSFGVPDGKGLAMALATFGIIGVGATELITYPYWCLEKGYARYTGWRTSDAAWTERAKGWMRVMHWDAFISMIVYTVATVAFYLMGAAVLYGEGRDPDGMRMVGTLAAAYVPVFGEYAKWLFLIGAIAVLYSTFLVANAGHARMFTDGLKIFGLIDRQRQSSHDRAITFFCVLLPVTCLAIFCSGINPVAAVAFAGMMQATMLPMIGFGALYSRWTATDTRLAPPVWWDVLLVASFVGLFVVGVYGVWSKIGPWLMGG